MMLSQRRPISPVGKLLSCLLDPQESMAHTVSGSSMENSDQSFVLTAPSWLCWPNTGLNLSQSWRHLGQKSKAEHASPAILSPGSVSLLRHPRARRTRTGQSGWGSRPGWRAGDREVPVGGSEQVAAGAPEASGEASAEQGPPPGRLEPGTEAGGRALAAEGPQAVGPGPAARVPAGPGEEARKRERGFS